MHYYVAELIVLSVKGMIGVQMARCNITISTVSCQLAQSLTFTMRDDVIV